MSYDRTLGIKIYLDEEHTQDTDIGLYTSAGESQIRLVENTFNGSLGAAETWKSGLLKRRAFSPIVESADLKKGGNVARNDTVNCTIINTSQYWKALADAEINIIGRRAEIWEFVKNRTTGLTTTYTMFYGIVTDPTWTETEYVIPVRDARFKRNANITRLVTVEEFPNATADEIGKTLPVRFGGDLNYPSEFTRVGKQEVLFQTAIDNDFGTNDSGETVEIKNLRNVDCTIFPITSIPVDGTPSKQYKIKISGPGDTLELYIDGVLDGPGPPYEFDLDYFNGWYMRVVVADGDLSSAVGSLRKITDSSITTLTAEIILDIEDAFEQNLGGNIAATSDNQCWIELVQADLNFVADTWPCEGLYTADGGAIDNAPEVYVYEQLERAKVTTESTDADIEREDAAYIKAPDFAIIEDGSDNNAFSMDAKYSKSNIENLNCWTFIKPETVERYTGDNIRPDFTDSVDSSFDIECLDGASPRGYFPNVKYTTDPSWSGDETNTYDKDGSSVSTLTFPFQATPLLLVKISIVHKVSFKRIEAGLNFDDAYLLYNADNSIPWGTTNSSKVYLQKGYIRRFLGDAKEEYRIDSRISGAVGVFTFPVTSVPPDYFISNPPADSDGFYFEFLSEAYDGDTEMGNGGYANFLLPSIKTIRDINSVEDFFLTHFMGSDLSSPGIGFQFTFSLYEVCLALRKSVSIGNSVYSYHKGRVFDDTWGARRTATKTMVRPGDILEHCLRLQNWSEVGDSEPTNGWGSAYSANALINTGSSRGGFDYLETTSIGGAVNANTHLKTFSKCETSNLISSLCKQFFLLSYRQHYANNATDTPGKECCVFLLDDSANTASIDLSDIIGGISPIKNPRREDIYCEPTIRYAYNPGSGKYEKEISITHTSETVYSSDYVTGITGTDAEEIWGKYSALYKKYSIVNDAPADLTDLMWVYDDATAKQYLWWLVEWEQLSRVSVTVGYPTAREWGVGKKIGLTLPHQTDGVEIDCIIERISKNMYDAAVDIDLILLDEVDTANLYIKDTWDNSFDEWKDETVAPVDIKDIT